jgi:periplasmic protein TonB
MKKLILILLFLITAGVANAQTNDTAKTVSKDTTKKFMPVEVEPSFPGGFEKLFMYFADHEKADGNEGKVRVSFVVEKDGSVSDIKIIQSLSDSADKEAIRLVSQMPKWNPGMQGGRPVRVQYNLPINFPAK